MDVREKLVELIGNIYLPIMAGAGYDRRISHSA